MNAPEDKNITSGPDTSAMDEASWMKYLKAMGKRDGLANIERVTPETLPGHPRIDAMYARLVPEKNDPAFREQIKTTLAELYDSYLRIHAKAKKLQPALGEPALYFADSKIAVGYTVPTPAGEKPSGRVVVTQAMLELFAVTDDPALRRSRIDGLIAHELGHSINKTTDDLLKAGAKLAPLEAIPGVSSGITAAAMANPMLHTDAPHGDVLKSAAAAAAGLVGAGVGMIRETGKILPSTMMNPPETLKPLLYRMKEDNADRMGVRLAGKQALVDFMTMMQEHYANDFRDKDGNHFVMEPSARDGYRKNDDRIKFIQSLPEDGGLPSGETPIPPASTPKTPAAAASESPTR